MLAGLLRNYQAYLIKVAEADYWEKMLNVLEKPSAPMNTILLDCGCNDGKNTLKVARYVGATKMYGIDVDEEALNDAQRKGIITYKADLNGRFPLDDKSVDVVFSNQVIEHLTNSLNFVREIYRVLRPNGYTVISTENLASWINILALILGWQPFSSKLGLGNPLILVEEEERMDSQYSARPLEPDIWCGYGYGTHNKVLAYRGLREIFEMNGFKVDKICGAGYHPFPGIVGRLLSNIDPCHAFYLILKARKLMAK